ncbi:MAG: hypothetical protein ABIS21_06535, partial [Acidimicrobiales bacterium]
GPVTVAAPTTTPPSSPQDVAAPPAAPRPLVDEGGANTGDEDGGMSRWVLALLAVSLVVAMSGLGAFVNRRLRG